MKSPNLIGGTAHRSVASERGVSWLTEAWPLFRDQPGLWLLIAVIGFGINLACGMVPLLSGLLSPFVSGLILAGMLQVASKQRAGTVPEVGDLFAILSDPKLPRLLVLTLIYLALSVAAGLAAAIVVGLGGGMAALTGAIGNGDAASALALGGSVALGALIFLAAMAPILAMYWFAIPLVLFRDAEPWQAMTASLRATLANLMPLLVYGVLVLIMFVLACIPLMLGLLVAFPLLAISLLASFEDVFPVSSAATGVGPTRA